jgi:soluble lytic murein transglycosylase-like protein
VEGIAAVEARISEIRQRMSKLAPQPPVAGGASFADVLSAAVERTASATTTPAVGGSVDIWVADAMSATGVPADWEPGLRAIIRHESSGRPDAVNNATGAGEPAVGLMQMLPSTFAAHAQPGHGDIRNPVDNLMAAIDYIRGRYGHPDRTPGLLALARGDRYRGY